jgi:hypothetical protein
MRVFVTIFILCLSFLSLHGQEILGYFKSPSSDFHNFRWQKLSRNDTAFLVIKQERKYSTKYVISYNDIKVKFKIDNGILFQLDSVCVHLEKIKCSHVTFFWMHVFDDSHWSGIGHSVPPARHVSKSIIIHVYPKPEYAMNGPIQAHNNALRIKQEQKRVYVYNEKKGKFIKVSREKALQMVEEDNLPQLP